MAKARLNKVIELLERGQTVFGCGTIPVWRGGPRCFSMRSGGKNCIHTSAELYY